MTFSPSPMGFRLQPDAEKRLIHMVPPGGAEKPVEGEKQEKPKDPLDTPEQAKKKADQEKGETKKELDERTKKVEDTNKQLSQQALENGEKNYELRDTVKQIEDDYQEKLAVKFRAYGFPNPDEIRTIKALINGVAGPLATPANIGYARINLARYAKAEQALTAKAKTDPALFKELQDFKLGWAQEMNAKIGDDKNTQFATLKQRGFGVNIGALTRQGNANLNFGFDTVDSPFRILTPEEEGYMLRAGQEYDAAFLKRFGRVDPRQIDAKALLEFQKAFSVDFNQRVLDSLNDPKVIVRLCPNATNNALIGVAYSGLNSRLRSLISTADVKELEKKPSVTDRIKPELKTQKKPDQSKGGEGKAKEGKPVEASQNAKVVDTQVSAALVGRPVDASQADSSVYKAVAPETSKGEAKTGESTDGVKLAEAKNGVGEGQVEFKNNITEGGKIESMINGQRVTALCSVAAGNGKFSVIVDSIDGPQKFIRPILDMLRKTGLDQSATSTEVAGSGKETVLTFKDLSESQKDNLVAALKAPQQLTLGKADFSKYDLSNKTYGAYYTQFLDQIRPLFEKEQVSSNNVITEISQAQFEALRTLAQIVAKPSDPDFANKYTAAYKTLLETVGRPTNVEIKLPTVK